MLVLTSYDDFSKLRLDQFCSGEISSTGAAIWEWMDGAWYCDAIGFSWFGCLEDMPDQTGCMEVDLLDLPQHESQAILSAIGLPLTAGMRLEAVEHALGAPIEVMSFVDDRNTYVFQVGPEDSYIVDCTIQDDAGLIFVSVLREDVRQRISA
jgi:hypothetical protein